jgi:GPI-anchor transamidase subunit K
MIDTCQANTMYTKLYSPNIIATGSSELDQSSYSHHADNDIGVAVIDRYTYYNLEFLEAQVKDRGSKMTVGDLFDSYKYEKIHSHAGVRYDLFRGGQEAARSRLLTDFFGNVQRVEVTQPINRTEQEEMQETIQVILAMREEEERQRRAAEKNSTASHPAPEDDAPPRRLWDQLAGSFSWNAKNPYAYELNGNDWLKQKLIGAAVWGSLVTLFVLCR